VSGNPDTQYPLTTNIYTDVNVANPTQYFYTVTATNQCGESASSAEATGVPDPVGTKVALLVADDIDGTGALTPSPGHPLIQTQLQNMGYTVSAMSDTVAQSSDATGKQMVYISASVDSAEVVNHFDITNVPAIVAEPSIMGDMRMSGTEETAASQTQVTVAIAG